MSKFTEFFDVEEITLDQHKQAFIDNLNMLKAMTVQEQTLYKKYKEVTTYYAQNSDQLRIVKAKIWVPTDIMNKELTLKELSALVPRVRVVSTEADKTDWTYIRIFVHTMEFDQNPGRFIKLLIYDEVTGKYLGAAAIGSDVLTLTARDSWIGWDYENRVTNGKVANTAICTCIMATQPFGYNFLGGKLVASLLTTKVISDIWQEKYKNILVGLTTTSLYGQDSMYNSIPFWKKMGKSTGGMSIKPDDDVYKFWSDYIKLNKTAEYDKKINSKTRVSGPATAPKQQMLALILKEVGISMSKYKHGFERGVYFAPLYENTREFLQEKITSDQLIPAHKLKDDVDAVINWWKPKAMKRYEALYDEGRIKPEVLFYSNLIGLTWDEVKTKYLGEVGR